LKLHWGWMECCSHTMWQCLQYTCRKKSTLSWHRMQCVHSCGRLKLNNTSLTLLWYIINWFVRHIAFSEYLLLGTWSQHCNYLYLELRLKVWFVLRLEGILFLHYVSNIIPLSCHLPEPGMCNITFIRYSVTCMTFHAYLIGFVCYIN
jgi:hypothetical protein